MNGRHFVAMLGGLALANPALAQQSSTDPCADTTDFVPIYEIQGAGHVSPFVGQTVVTCGVVTAVGFDTYYIQDPQGDGDDRTSDGMVVFTGRDGAKPVVGELVRLEDQVDERIPGGPDTGNLSTTQFAFPTLLERESSAVPAPVIIGRGGRVPPATTVISDSELSPPINLQDEVDAAANTFNPDVDGIDFYESLEGMLVTVESPVAVSAIRQFGTFSAEVFVLANDGADVFPVDARTARGGINLQPDPDNRGDQNPERVQIQFDGTFFGSTNYPAIQVGDQLDDVTGVVGYSFGNFEVNALGPFGVTTAGLTQEHTNVFGILGRLRVAAYNVLNLSAVSADDAQRAEIAKQIAVNLRAPQIIALQEIQDNNGDINNCPRADEDNPNASDPCSFELDASLTLQRLVDEIVAAGGPEYKFFDVAPKVETTDDNRDDPDTFGGVSLGNIRNAFLYDPERVSLDHFVGLDRAELARRGVTALTAFDTSRDPLEAVFRFRGQKVVVINNHFSSRFGSTPIFGGPQPFEQAAEAAREAQALAMNEVTQWHIDHGRDKVVVLGDLNTFEFTDDLTEILPGTGRDKILWNLVHRNLDDNNYSFIFEGNSQVLDHIFVTRGLSRFARFDFVHVNNDFPRLFSSVVGSDHEPIVAALTVLPRKDRKRRFGRDDDDDDNERD